MKTIGIIGGMSYESSIHYYERINHQVNKAAGGLTSAKMLLYNVNFEEYRQLMLEDRWDRIDVMLADIAKTLEKGGADYIAIATNTMHKSAEYIQSRIHIPLIHIADCVAENCRKKNVTKVGLLGTKYTMVEDFLIRRLEQNGLTVFVPGTSADIDEVDRVIFEELCKGIIKEDSREYYTKVIGRMINENGIEGVILGCTEVEMLIRPKDVPVPVFDTTQSHIDAITDYSLGRRE